MMLSIKSNPKETNPYAAVKAPSEEQYHSCIRCGLCVPGCPTYQSTHSETESPRGRVMLARKVLEGKLAPSENLKDQMNKCMDCLACNSICPVGIKPADLALDMRYAAEQSKPTGWKNIVFDKLLPHPARLEAGTIPLRLYQKLGLRWLIENLGVHALLPAKFRDIERQLPIIPEKPLRMQLPEVTPAFSKAERKVAFFLGCGQSLLHAESSKATLRVLAKNGCEIHTPRETKCCGMPSRGYGRMDEALEMASFNIALYEKLDVEVIITDCATCGSMLKEYAHFFADDSTWAERAEVFASKIRDISEYLMEIPLQQPQGEIEGRVTYHDPCHMVRGQDVSNQPRELIKNISGLEFVEMKDADQCCGSAGSQLVTHYKSSSAILDRKVANVLASKASIVASGCPACRMQLTTGIKRTGNDLEVVHPVELLDRAYQSETKEECK